VERKILVLAVLQAAHLFIAVVRKMSHQAVQPLVRKLTVVELKISLQTLLSVALPLVGCKIY
jgi:hypothetical protein